MAFGIEKCAKRVMKSGKRHLTDGMEMPNQDKLEHSEKRKLTKILEDIGKGHHQIRGYERKN